MSSEKALSRTTRLVNQEIFDGRASEPAITRGLLATTVRLVADETNMSSIAGQAALISAFQLIARMGIGIELRVPDLPLVANVPPLKSGTLRAALVELGGDLVPGLTVRTSLAHADETFVFGDSAYEGSDAIYVSASDTACSLQRGQQVRTRIDADFAFGGLAAAAVAAAIALNAALPAIERESGVARSERRRPSPGPPVSIDLAALFPTLTEPVRLTEGLKLDGVSAGAIINAFIAVSLWVLQTPTVIRVIDDDLAELSNVNRCPQICASDKRPKVDVLRDSSTTRLQISGEQSRFTADTAAHLSPLAEHIVVGVDDIPARWLVQQAAPDALYIGATTNHEAILTTHHPGEPCAGCAYPHPATEEEFVPTISFVSFWAGLLQACALLTELVQRQTARRITVFPFALGEPTWFLAHPLYHGAECAISCNVSGKHTDAKAEAA
jgi:hypothetical protein